MISISATLVLAYLVLTLGVLERVIAFDLSRNDNLAVYWGQDGAGNQKRLSFYCKDSTIDVFPIAFLYIFRGEGGEPVIDFANTCNQWDDPTYAGTALANCSFLAQDIKTCQTAGKLVTLSLGGATGQVGFSSDTQAESFADQIWNLFLGGESDIRPFGDAVLDGIDLDIESGKPTHYAAFVNRIRANAGETGLNSTTFAAARAASALTTHGHATTASPTSHHTITHKNESVIVDVTSKEKYYYFTAAPQCPYPDAYIGAALNDAPFDAVYVQFYNNYCGLDQPADYNFATWDKWARTKSANPHVRVYIGAAGSADAAGEGYVDADVLAEFVADAQTAYPSFGGVMMWDVDSAYSNDRYDLEVKTSMVASAERITRKEKPRNGTGAKGADEETEPVKKPRAKSRFFRL